MACIENFGEQMWLNIIRNGHMWFLLREMRILMVKRGKMMVKHGQMWFNFMSNGHLREFEIRHGQTWSKVVQHYL